MQKYSSNVLEKCFQFGKENIVELFIKEVCLRENVTGMTIFITF